MSFLKFEDFDAVGFDIDHTLIRYRLDNLFEVACNGLLKYFVCKHKYSADIISPFSNHQNLCERGLALSLSTGDLLKLDDDHVVFRALNGLNFHSETELTSCYGSHKFEHASDIIDDCTKRDMPWVIFETFFDMPGIIAWARLIEANKKTNTTVDFKQLFQQMIQSFNFNYNPEQFRANRGHFFPLVIAKPEDYIIPCTDQLKTWLRKLKASGKKLFLLSSSYADFATFVLRFALGADWESYFDLSIFGARKPAFFTSNNPFYSLSSTLEEGDTVEQLSSGNKYSGGNFKMLNDFLSTETGKQKPKVSTWPGIASPEEHFLRITTKLLKCLQGI